MLLSVSANNSDYGNSYVAYRFEELKDEFKEQSKESDQEESKEPMLVGASADIDN